MGSEESQATVTRLLGELRDGGPGALDALFPLVYGELQELARRQRRRWRGDHTLGTTALVHEAYLKLVDQARIDVEGRAHFFGLAARAMRHILCNYARERGARKRGGDLRRLSLDDLELSGPDGALADGPSETLVALDDALARLEALDPRQSRVVECRFFGGMTIEETATAMGVSPRTVKRDWAVAQAWLHRELEGPE